MKKYKDSNNKVHEIDEGYEYLLPSGCVEITEEEANEINKPPQKTVQELTELVRLSLQSAIDERARSYGFSGGNALMLYAGFANYFQPLAQQFATWEASVWVEAEAYKADVIAGLKPMLSPIEAVALMPVYPS